MTVTLELSPQVELAARRAAEARGVAIEVVLQEMLADRVEPPLLHNMTPRQRAQAFQEWANSPRSYSSPLSDEVISRESIYEERMQRLL